MSNNFDKLWVQTRLNTLAINRAQQVLNQVGMSLPCSVVSVDGSFVTVKFEVNSGNKTLPNIKIPKAEGQWIRTPTQVGEFGITLAVDADIMSASGVSTGAPTLATPGNLTALVYVPIANKNFTSVNVNAAYIAGPEGVVLKTEDGMSSIVINESGITLTFNGNTITFNGSGLTSEVPVQVNSTIDATGDITAGTISLQTHVHSGVTSGGSNSGPPV